MSKIVSDKVEELDETSSHTIPLYPDITSWGLRGLNRGELTLGLDW
jgi:hypothetical protein